MVGLKDCESVATRLKTKRMVAEKYMVRRFFSIQQALEGGELENAFWIPGTENSADGLAEVRSDMVPLLRLFEPGGFRPGQLRPLKGVAWKELGSHVTHSNSICTCTNGWGSCVLGE